jgi:shikimate dehydrogenase
VASGQAVAALEAMRTLGISGLSVTMPHKEAVADACDSLSADAAMLHAVNCVVNDGGRLVGHNTDGAGFIAAIDAELGFDPAGRRCVVLGAGGAARAIALALRRSDAADVAIVNRTAARARDVASIVGTAGRAVGVDGLGGAVERAELIVNATSVGMGPSGGIPLDASLLHAEHTVVDIVYRPLRTPLLEAARDCGARSANGVSMLVHQAAIAFTLWTGQDAPVEAMTAAVATMLVD